MQHVFTLHAHLRSLRDRSALRPVLRMLATHRLLLQSVTASTAATTGARSLHSHPLIAVSEALMTPPPQVCVLEWNSNSKA